MSRRPGAARRVLFLRHDRIGDMIMSTAVLRAIAASDTAIALDVVASPANAPVLDGLAFVHEVIPFVADRPRDALRFGLSLRRRRYDAVVDGFVLTRKVTVDTAYLVLGCGAPVRVGMGGGRKREWVYTTCVAPPEVPPGAQCANHVDYLAQLALPFGVAHADVGRPTIALSGAERAAAGAAWAGAEVAQGRGARRLLVNVSAGNWRRRWSDRRFVEALRAVRRRGAALTFGIIGEPGERAAVHEVAAAAGAAAFPTPTVRAALALVAAADVVLTPDTAIAHAAAAFEKPCVTLMLPGAEPFAPYRTPGRLVRSPDMLMNHVPVGQVVAALDEVLGEEAGGVPADR